MKHLVNARPHPPVGMSAAASSKATEKLRSPTRPVPSRASNSRPAARGVALPRQVAPEPKEMGQVLTDLHEKPGRLRDILGPGGAQPQQQAQGSNPITNLLTSPQAKAVLAGITAMVAKRVMQGSFGTA